MLFLVLLLSLFLRVYRLPEVAQFRYDEARDMIAERRMLTERKLTMLGPESQIGDKTIYFGPLHYYLMAPSLAVARFDPLGPYVFTAILGTATTLVIFLMTRSLPAAAFYAVFPLAVIYNRWAWNPNTIPLFAALALWFLIKKRFFWAGMFFGLMLQLHITAIAFAILFLPFWKKGHWILLGAVFGLLPMIIFDLRHEGFYLEAYRSLTGSQFSSRGLNWHYFLWLLPLLALIVSKIDRRVAIMVIILSLAGTIYWLTKLEVAAEVHPARIKQLAAMIAADHRERNGRLFNVASFVDPVARATAYRYFLQLNGVSPLDVDQYPEASDLYVITFEAGDKVLYNRTYEVASFGPKKIGQTWAINNEYLYRLEK